MKSEAEGTVRISAEGATGRIGFVRTTSGDLLPSADANSAQGAAAKAGAYLDKYSAAFGARRDELRQSAVRKTLNGWTVEFTQSHRDVPVFAAELRAHVDSQGDLTAVNGFAAPALDVDVTPRVTKADAATRAVRLVKAAPSGARGDVNVSGLQAVSNELMIYRMGATRGTEGESLLAWVLEVSNEHNVREMVILDARTGKPVNRWSMMAHALERELHEAHDNGTPEDLSDDTKTLEWAEGDPFPAGLDEDQENEVLGAGETYWMFMNTFGYDSYDGAGAKMVTVNNDPSIECPNANWNGVTTNYCSGVSSDDTVAHEWGHAYTEYTSGLIYQWQSGAMNEAYSDIWGETVDMLNDRQNESEAQPRTPGDCSIYSPTRARIQVLAPTAIAGPCTEVKATGGPAFPKTPTDVTLVVGVDEVEPEGGVETDGCSPFENADAIAGNWVYVEENLETACGQASYSALYEVMEQNAVEAGAAGLIVGAWPGDSPWDMPGDFTIPAAQVTAQDSERFKSVMPGPVTIQVSESTNERDSHRWLSGEDDPAFGGAIRDMWNPTCYGDPGKVSDEEYHCETSDSGGVHTNSGVVNHAFALMVDGSTYNGVTVPAIGLDKAANIFWRTQTEYLTPTSDFADLADGLAAACSDLRGQAINAVTLGDSLTGGGEALPERADRITVEDCAAVDLAAQAVELGNEPVQCEFGPLLAKNTPAICGEGFVSETTWSEDFEDGLAGWTQDEELVFAGTTGIPWQASTSASGSHAGGVAFAADPTTGSCQGDEDDISGRNGLISPAVTYPTGSAPRLSFDHYVATEVLWDGGNVKVSIGGGAFSAIPAAAYVFNAPGANLEPEEEDNTNPMAGEIAFTGTDGGEPTGSWGTSIVDLSAIVGADPGDELKFRFDLGRDGCNGVDGWYVDNVKVQVCETVASPTPTPTTSPTTTPTPTPTTTPTPVVKVKTKIVLKTPKWVKVRSGRGKVTFVVTGKDLTPSGAVKVKIKGAGRSKTVTVMLDAAGKGKVKLPMFKQDGRVKVKVEYLGDVASVPSSEVKRFRVVD